MQLIDRSKRLHGGDLATIRLHREHQAGANGRTVDNNSAGAADSVFAADMRAVQVEIVSQEIA